MVTNNNSWPLGPTPNKSLDFFGPSIPIHTPCGRTKAHRPERQSDFGHTAAFPSPDAFRRRARSISVHPAFGVHRADSVHSARRHDRSRSRRSSCAPFHSRVAPLVFHHPETEISRAHARLYYAKRFFSLIIFAPLGAHFSYPLSLTANH